MNWTRIKNVSIPYGKGKGDFSRIELKIIRVSIPYGKGKGKNGEPLRNGVKSINSLWER